MEAFIHELLSKYKVDHKIATDDAAKQQITDKLAKTKPKAHGTTVCMPMCVYGRLCMCLHTVVDDSMRSNTG